jgi:predicted Rossmann fold flavoprotein
METHDVLVIGGGAGGFFGAITAAEARPGTRVLIVEKATQPLAKVRVSGGGRCNVTHSCFEPRTLSARYPRGGRALLSAFSRFQPSDTVAWFEKRGVQLKTEVDGRMFPISDNSETIVECLRMSASRAGVGLRVRTGVEALHCEPEGLWTVRMSDSATVRARSVLVATGGCRSGNVPALLTGLGHTLARSVPSLFTFHVEKSWVRALAGLALDAQVSVPGARLGESGPVLFTHWGLSGPAILRLSAWGARELEERDYRFPLRINWAPEHTEASLRDAFLSAREKYPGRTVVNHAACVIPSRLWEALCVEAGVTGTVRWNQLPRPEADRLIRATVGHELHVTGKSLHKDEFVTCGGVRLPEVDMRTMESRVARGLYFAGEVLDIDGITGGFNFQAAWTTGWIAGRAIGEALPGV